MSFSTGQTLMELELNNQVVFSLDDGWMFKKRNSNVWFLGQFFFYFCMWIELITIWDFYHYDFRCTNGSLEEISRKSFSDSETVQKQVLHFTSPSDTLTISFDCVAYLQRLNGGYKITLTWQTFSPTFFSERWRQIDSLAYLCRVS